VPQADSAADPAVVEGAVWQVVWAVEMVEMEERVGKSLSW
jgi:hypothetical protein